MQAYLRKFYASYVCFWSVILAVLRISPKRKQIVCLSAVLRF